jgi:hypothetical protein
MHPKFFKGFIKAAHSAGLNEDQAIACLFKLADGMPGPGTAGQIPPLSGSNGMMPGGNMGAAQGVGPGGPMAGAPMSPNGPNGCIHSTVSS